MPKLTCAVSGSFRRFLDDVRSAIRELRALGVRVLSPPSTEVAGELDGFVMLKGDRGDPSVIEQAHLQGIARSDFLYVVNPEGYIGRSASLEIGYALACSVPVFCSSNPSEEMMLGLVVVKQSLPELVATLEQGTAPGIQRGSSLAALQAYVAEKVRERGFEDESLRDAVLLLVEEIGELAKATRCEMGLKVNAADPLSRKSVQHELADCLVYLLDIANLSGVDLEEALREKESVNSQKRWATHPEARKRTGVG